jgi:hypothetical protein
MDTGAEQISNVEEKLQLRRQSRAVYAKSLVAGVLLTALALAL